MRENRWNLTRDPGRVPPFRIVLVSKSRNRTIEGRGAPHVLLVVSMSMSIYRSMRGWGARACLGRFNSVLTISPHGASPMCKASINMQTA